MCRIVILLALGGLYGSAAPGLAQPPPSAASEQSDPPRISWSADFTVASVLDESLRGALGRERQIKPVAALLTFDARITPRVSLRITANPVRDDRAPKPYVPLESDRRTYFFPNQPDAAGGRGVASNPEGLYKVDAYKHTGLDPILQMYLLRTGYADIHNTSGTAGAQFGRFYVRQGLALDELTWFTAKDLTSIQLVNAQADNGVALYLRRPRFDLTAQVITGNGSPYHDYAYFDFTDSTEDKNSSVGVVMDARARLARGSVVVGGSYRRNFVGSRVEDGLTLQLSKHNDDAIIAYARAGWRGVEAYGEWALYTVGLARTSAELVQGPVVKSPVTREGYYAGLRIRSPSYRRMSLAGVVEAESMSRNDALVAWAAASQLYGARLGANINAVNLKLVLDWTAHVAVFSYVRLMKNPFPQLSAIVPISGPNADRGAAHDKMGLGLRVRF